MINSVWLDFFLVATKSAKARSFAISPLTTWAKQESLTLLSPAKNSSQSGLSLANRTLTSILTERIQYFPFHLLHVDADYVRLQSFWSARRFGRNLPQAIEMFYHRQDESRDGSGYHHCSGGMILLEGSDNRKNNHITNKKTCLVQFRVRDNLIWPHPKEYRLMTTITQQTPSSPSDLIPLKAIFL